MANFRIVNAYIRKTFPKLEIEAVRSEDCDYVYFAGHDGFDKVATLWVHPTSTPTDVMVEMVCQEIREVYP